MHLDILQIPSPLHPVIFPEWEPFGVKVFFKRDDLIHPVISGNKWRKLSGHLQKYNAGEYQGMMTYGGAFSNHIIAVAGTCNLLGIPSYGLIRGEIDAGNPALRYAQEQGMNLLSLSRTAYKNKDLTGLIEKYPAVKFDTFLQVPEGGAGIEGLEGCTGIISEMDIHYDYIISASGTGTTVAGLSSYVKDNVRVLGISVLKGKDTLTDDIRMWSHKENFEIITGYHFGGYARYTQELIDFAKRFTKTTGVPLDFVYTSKMVFAFHDLLIKGVFKSGDTIVLLHTGGLMNAQIDE